MRGTGRPLGKTFFLHCQRRHPELPKIPTYLPQQREADHRTRQMNVSVIKGFENTLGKEDMLTGSEDTSP